MKDIVVAKFGGSSLADAVQFTKVKNIIGSNSNRRYIIPSAPGKRSSEDTKVTDLLYLCHEKITQGLDSTQIFDSIKNRFQDISTDLALEINMEKHLDEIKFNVEDGASRDYIASRGEYLNGIILAKYLGYEFIDAKELIVFKMNRRFDAIATEEKISNRLSDVENAVIPGFYGANENGDVITFSRGGSDFTGAIIANGVRASLYENWTDVSGFLIADPRIVSDAKTIELVTYTELRELSYMGAPVLHEEVIFPVKKYGIPINIKNTNKPEDEGTMIVDESTNPPIKDKITGISGKKDFTVITIYKTFMNSEIGFIRKVAGVFEDNNISIEHIPSSIDSLSAIVSSKGLDSKMNKVKEDIQLKCESDSITVHPNMALIAVVGRGLAQNKGISGNVFAALADNGINIRMISQDSSELNIIIGIENDDYDRAVEAIYSIVR